MPQALLITVLSVLPPGDRQQTLEIQSLIEWNVYSTPPFPLQSIDSLSTRLLAKEDALDPASRFVLYNRRAYCRLLQLQEAYDEKMCRHAIADFGRALKLRPNNLSSQLGKLYAESFQEFSLHKILKESIQLHIANPKSKEAAYLVGLCQLRTQNARKALSVVDSALKNDPNFGAAILLRAMVRLALRESTSCVADVRRSLGCVPHSFFSLSRAYEVYGLACLQAGEFQIGEGWLLKSYRISKKPSKTVREALWYCSTHHGRFAHSLLYARELTKIAPRDPHGYWMYALSSAQIDRSSKNLDRSLLLCQKALSLSPGERLAHRALAIVEDLRGNVGVALKEYQRVLNKHPGNPDAALRVSFILATNPDVRFRNGKMALAAARAALRSLKSKKMRVYAMSVLAVAHAENKEFEQAIDTIDKAIEMAEKDPSFATMLKKLRLLFEKEKPYRSNRKKNSPLFVLRPTDLFADSF